jgi:hypothetical protein
MRTLFELVAGPVVTDPGSDATLCGLLVCAVDGFQTRTPNTRTNRAAFRSSGTSDNSAPFPQLRAVIITVLAGRGILGAAMDASSVGEQTLIRRLVEDHPEVFAAGRVFIFDRNFLGHDLIVDLVRCGAHLVMRVKSDVNLHFIRWLPDGSYLAYINAPDRRSVLMLRIVEYDMALPGGVSEVFCLATTLRDWRAYPAHAVSEAYRQRWTASETTIGENKSTITDAGPSRGPILRSKEPTLVRQEFWAWLAATQLVRKSAHAATTTTDEVNTDQVSFTTARHEATRSLTQSLVTATTSPDALAAAAAQAARAALANLVVTGRDRHSPRTQKHRPKFSRTATTTPTTHGPFKINFSKAPVPADTSLP